MKRTWNLIFCGILALLFSLIGVFAAEKSELLFTDVKSGAWYESAVQYVYEQELFAGTSATTFSPDADMTRAMLVSVLWRQEGKPQPQKIMTIGGGQRPHPFSDVQTGTWYSDAVWWAEQNNIVSGMGDGIFAPNDPVTREQMASILMRYTKYCGIETKSESSLLSFADAAVVSPWARKAMMWATDVKIISGIPGEGTVFLQPQGKATRAQVASMQMRLIKSVIYAPAKGLLFRYENGGYTVAGRGRCESKIIVIPQTHEGAPVTAIAEKAFQGDGALCRLVIPGSVKTIRKASFYGCDSLRGVTLEEGILQIGDGAFGGCRTLESLVVPHSVETFDFSCVRESGLRSLVLHGGSEIMQEESASLSELEYLDLGDRVRALDGKFTYIKTLSHLRIGKNLERLNQNYFSRRQNGCVIEVDTENPVFVMKNGCLINTVNQTLVYGTENSVIPSDGSVQIIGESAFSHVSGIERIEIPASIHTIKQFAFTDSSFTELTIPGTVKTLEFRAFSGTAALKKVILEEGITKIPAEAFYWNKALTEISLPSTLRCVDMDAFGGCDALQPRTILDGIWYLGNAENPNLVLWKAEGVKGAVTVAQGTKVIMDRVFWNNLFLTEIFFPDSLLQIGYGAFYGCSAMSRATDATRLEVIGGLAFHSCGNLKYFVIPDTVRYIGEGAFYRFDKRQNLYFEAAPAAVFSSEWDKQCLANKYIGIGETWEYRDGIPQVK